MAVATWDDPGVSWDDPAVGWDGEYVQAATAAPAASPDSMHDVWHWPEYRPKPKPKTLTFTPRGGIEWSGHAQASFEPGPEISEYTPEGGTSFGGSAEASGIAVATTGGGVAFAGMAEPSCRMAASASGGLRFGGGALCAVELPMDEEAARMKKMCRRMVENYVLLGIGEE